MSNAAAAYYAFLALEDRERARVFRKFGYHASADMLDRRADTRQRRSDLEAMTDKEAPTLLPGPLGLPIPMNDANDLHRTSDSDQQTGLFAKQEPPA